MFGTVEMDLSKYGVEGKVVVGPLTFRRTKESQNAVTCALRRSGGTELSISDLNLGDIETVTKLAYVRSAPFSTDLMDLSGFYDWTDMLDEKRIGAAQEFYDDLGEAIEKVESGGGPPFGMMCGTCPDFEFGLHLYQEAVSNADSMGPEGALMHAYSLWLLGGGSPEGFEDLTPIDAMLMVATRNAEITRLRDGLLNGYAKLMGGFEDG